MRCLLLTSVVMLAGLTATASAEPPRAPLVAPSPGVTVAVPDEAAAALPDARVTHVPGTRSRGIKRTVYLNHLVLEELRKSNPEHYAQAQRVLAAASELCAPNSARVWQAMNLPQGSCAGMVLKTSYPPKREIGFAIEDTWYIALVTVKDAPALQIAPPGKVFPADTDAPKLVRPVK